MPSHPPRVDLHQIWNTGSSRRHNHLCQISWWLVNGGRFCGRQSLSSLTLIHYCSASDASFPGVAHSNDQHRTYGMCTVPWFSADGWKHADSAAVQLVAPHCTDTDNLKVERLVELSAVIRTEAQLQSYLALCWNDPMVCPMHDHTRQCLRLHTVNSHCELTQLFAIKALTTAKVHRVYLFFVKPPIHKTSVLIPAFRN